jgi:hypothetical protein
MPHRADFSLISVGVPQPDVISFPRSSDLTFIRCVEEMTCQTVDCFAIQYFKIQINKNTVS